MIVRLRDLHPGEHEPVQAVFDGLSPGSRNRRFHGPVERLSPAMLDVMSAADAHDHVVIVAETGGWRRRRTLGLARLVRTGPVTAELAVEVVDVAQGQGVGRRLVAASKARAAALGLRWIEADVLDDNAPMLHLLRDVFSGIEASRVGDVWELRCPVPSSDLQLADVLPPLQGVA